jgi:hypothetical protein
MKDVHSPWEEVFDWKFLHKGMKARGGAEELFREKIAFPLAVTVFGGGHKSPLKAGGWMEGLEVTPSSGSLWFAAVTPIVCSQTHSWTQPERRR